MDEQRFKLLVNNNTRMSSLCFIKFYLQISLDEFSSVDDQKHFFYVLGSDSPNELPNETVSEDDGTFEISNSWAVTLYQLTDQFGFLKITELSNKPLHQEMLDTRDCFILYTGSKVYVWIGKGATKKEKTNAMFKAKEFLRTKTYPIWTRTQRTIEGTEPTSFKLCFASWKNTDMSNTRLIRSA